MTPLNSRFHLLFLLLLVPLSLSVGTNRTNIKGDCRDRTSESLASHPERLQEPTHQLVLDALQPDFPFL